VVKPGPHPVARMRDPGLGHSHVISDFTKFTYLPVNPCTVLPIKEYYTAKESSQTKYIITEINAEDGRMMAKGLHVQQGILTRNDGDIK
jgi:hypothetical protein